MKDEDVSPQEEGVKVPLVHIHFYDSGHAQLVGNVSGKGSSEGQQTNGWSQSILIQRWFAVGMSKPLC